MAATPSSTLILIGDLGHGGHHGVRDDGAGPTMRQIIAVVGPIALLLILMVLITVAIRIYKVRKDLRRSKGRDGELDGYPGVSDRDTSVPAAPIIEASTGQSHAGVPRYTSEAILNYWGTPKRSQDMPHGVRVTEYKVYDPNINPYLAARRGPT